MIELDLIAGDLLEDFPSCVPCSRPDLGVVAAAYPFHDDGYLLVAVDRGRRATCAVVPFADAVKGALGVTVAAGIGSEGLMSRFVMNMTTASSLNPLHVAAAETADGLRGAHADPEELAAAEARAVAVARSGEEASPGQLEEDGIVGACLDEVCETMGLRLHEQGLPLLESFDDIAERLHFPTLCVLAWSQRYTAAAYEWYREPGPLGRARRLAALRISAFAGLVGDDPEARAAFDADGDLPAALRIALARDLGRDVPDGIARALVDAEFEPPPYARRLALAALCEIQPDRFPKGDSAQRAFWGTAWATRTLWSPERPGGFAALVGDVPGNGWTGLAYELSGVDLSPIPGPDQIQDAIEGRVGQARHLGWFISTVAGMPALLVSGACAPGSDEGRERARLASIALLCEGRDLREPLDAASRFDAIRHAVHPTAVSGTGGDNLTWPALHDPFMATGGLHVLSLHDLRAIHDEGGMGPDAQGLDGLANGASSRSAPCALGGCFLSSVRAPDGRRLGTLVIGHEDGRFTIDGCGGPSGDAPPAEVWAVAEAFVAALNDGTLPSQRERSLAWAEALGPEGAEAASCGYDWRDEGNVRRAVDAFRPFLGPIFANLPYEDIVARLASSADAPSPRPRTVAKAAYSPPTTVARTFRNLRRRIGLWIAGIDD